MATAEEQEAFLWLQGRMVELLLRHDARRLGSNFATRLGALFDDERHAALKPYRELAVLIYLRDELLDSILPRIKRRLSFLAPRDLLVEELPPRGRIDWARTMTASLRDRPGEPPLEVQTRQRRRHFTTPENLLTVATILEYREAVQTRLDAEFASTNGQALRHPLREIQERCTRELAFPQFVGLVGTCEQIVSGYTDQTTADLERAVEDQLLPGRNSAYDDLLAWRRNLAALRLLDRPTEEAAPMLGADPARDNYLYQIWLFYELAELLASRNALEAEDWNVGEMRLRFRWGEGADAVVYRLQHDRAIPHHWNRAPGVRPDLYLERDDRDEVRHEGQLIWQEPGYVLDAKYYKPRDSARAPSGAVKRMIADLHLTGERSGALLFAFQSSEKAADADDNDVLDDLRAPAPTGPLYRVTPATAAAQVARPDAAVSVWRARPTIGAYDATSATLVALLDEAHHALRTRVEVACHGIFLDSLSAAERMTLVASDGVSLADPGDILICPKPHVGPWRADLVSRSRTCCTDPRLCHILGQVGAQKPVRPPRDINDLLKELEHILADAALGGETGQLTEEAIAAVSQRVHRLTRTFADVFGVDFEYYYQRLRDLGMSETLELLATVEREGLALAVFLTDQLDRIKANDYSAPAIHLSSVMEVEIKRRVFACPDLVGDLALPKRQTLGVLPYLRRSDDLEGNWQRIQRHVAVHWNDRPDPDDPQRVVRFDDLITKAINRISQLRNTAAHTDPLPRREYTELQGIILQGGKLGYGALNSLLLGWQAAETPPQHS
jgi:hypothetical protein